VHEVTERGVRSGWLDLLEDELGYLMALCRLESERRKEAVLAAKAEASGAAEAARAEKRGIAFLLDHGQELEAK
jgi:hypothetical protein